MPALTHFTLWHNVFNCISNIPDHLLNHWMQLYLCLYWFISCFHLFSIYYIYSLIRHIHWLFLFLVIVFGFFIWCVWASYYIIYLFILYTFCFFPHFDLIQIFVSDRYSNLHHALSNTSWHNRNNKLLQVFDHTCGPHHLILTIVFLFLTLCSYCCRLNITHNGF